MGQPPILEAQRQEGGTRVRGAPTLETNGDKPSVSIITVVRNGERHLEQCIQSVLEQTYSPLEHIIIDGASTDGTLDILRKYEDKVAYWVSEPDAGMYDASNKGSQLARGDYALYLNVDDYLSGPDSISRLVAAGTHEGERPLLIAGKVRYSWNDEILDWHWPIDERRLHRYGPAHQATLIASSIYKTILYNTDLRVTGDLDLWQRLRLQGLFQVKYVDTLVSIYRLGGVSSNATKTEYYAYVEREILRYLNYRRFNVLHLLRGWLFAAVKIATRTLLGDRIYYRYMLYGVYLFRKRFL